MNKFFEVLGKVTDILYLSILWLVFSLPLITIGASTTALYHSVVKVFLDDRGYITKEFWSAFKSNFKQSTIVWLLVLLISGVVVIDFLILKNLISDTLYNVLLVVLIYVLINLIMFINCLFPSIARFNTTLKQLYMNSFVIIMANLPWNLLVLLMFAATVLIVWFVPITIVFMPAVYMIGASKIFEHIFKKYYKTEEQEQC